MATLDLPLNIGLSFSVNGQIRLKSKPGQYVSWAGAVLTFSAEDADTGLPITELAASSGGGSPRIIISGPDNRVFSVLIPPSATTGLTFREANYSLVVTWTVSGDMYPIITGVLTPVKVAGAA